MKVITEESQFDINDLNRKYLKSPSSLSPTEKIQLLEEMNLDWKVIYEWLNGAEKLKGSLAIFGYPSLRQYIEEMK